VQKKSLEYISRFPEITNLNIIFLGDIVDGEGVYPSQSVSLELNADEQIDYALNRFTLMLDRYDEHFEHINAYCVRGNHGRTSKFNSEQTNYDVMFYKQLASAFRKERKYNFTIYDEWFGIPNICGNDIMLHHGDTIKMYQSIPLYGIVQKNMRWLTGGLPTTYTAMLMGHFHTSYSMTWNNVKVELNGTMTTDDDFSQKMGLISCNEYKMIISERSAPILHTYNIDVYRR
jgi:hypothetical protein